MTLPVTFAISWRYLASRRKEKFISIISIISIAGIAIGVTALIVVLAVMSGFDRDLKDKIIGNYSHIVIAKETGMSEYHNLRKALLAQPHVKGASPNVMGQVFVTSGSKIFALGLKGIDPQHEPDVTKLKDYMIRGELKSLAADTVIIGRELALYMGLGVGETLKVFSPQGKMYPLKVAGIFNSGMYEYDLNLMYVNIKEAQKIFGIGDIAGEMTVKLDDLYLAEASRSDIQKLLGPAYIVKTWIQKNPTFFAALALEKLTMFIILTLIILVAAFNIASTLIVMVTDKIKDIGILRAVGMTRGNIRTIFIIEGILIGGLGVLLGVAGGVGLCALLEKYQFIKLPADIYYIDHLPVALTWWPDIGVILICAMGITLLSTFYPAFKASGLNTVDALRYE